MSLETRLGDLIAAIGADIKALQAAGGVSQESRTTTYVNSTITGTEVFTGFTPAPNKRYSVEALLAVQANATTTGVQTAILGPTSGITRATIRTITPSTSAAYQYDNVAGMNGFSWSNQGLITPTLLSIQGIIVVGAAPGVGNIRIGARSEVAIANGVQIFPGSYMRWWEV